MATTFKWVTPEALTTSLSTELNGLANGAYTAASATITNETGVTGLYEFMALELVLSSLTPTGTPSISVFLLPAVDTTPNFEDGGGAVAPANGTLLCVFDLSTSVGAKRRTRWGLQIPPFDFKLVVLNSAGPALGATLNTLKFRRSYEQGV
ncbi:MAG: hypothetical protein NVSMB60_08030 [Mycobacterium sp.]